MSTKHPELSPADYKTPSWCVEFPHLPTNVYAQYMNDDPETHVVEIRGPDDALLVIMSETDYRAIRNSPKLREPK